MHTPGSRELKSCKQHQLLPQWTYLCDAWHSYCLVQWQQTTIHKPWELSLMHTLGSIPNVEVVRRSTSAPTTTIPKLECIFVTHGIPTVLCSENRPPFTSHQFKRYLGKDNGIKHRRTTPWPQANSEAESSMKPLTKAIWSAHTEGKKWAEHLHRFLLNYWTTPHTTTGQTPATLLFNRKVWNKLPQLMPKVSDKQLRETDHKAKAKAKMKNYADTKRRVKPSSLSVGDTVLIRQPKHNKFSIR